MPQPDGNGTQVTGPARRAAAGPVQVFLCGCPVGERVGYSRRLDSEGFELCPEHGVRRYGWRSVLNRVREGKA